MPPEKEIQTPVRKFGAIVRKGQLPSEIDPSVYAAKVDGDRAQRLNQRAQLADRQAQIRLARLQASIGLCTALGGGWS